MSYTIGNENKKNRATVSFSNFYQPMNKIEIVKKVNNQL